MKQHPIALLVLVSSVALSIIGSSVAQAQAPQPWVANQESEILSSTVVRLQGEAGVANTSVETQDLEYDVQSGNIIAFEYELFDGAQCTDGAPQVFIEVGGVLSNSWDLNIGAGTQCGTDGIVSFTVPADGSIGQMGIVYDNGGPGYIIVSNLTIAGDLIQFQSPLGTVVVNQNTNPETNGGTTFRFGGGLGPFSLDDHESEAFDVPAGAYVIEQEAESGWMLEDIECSVNALMDLNDGSVEIVLEEGGTVECTFVNAEVPVPTATPTATYTVTPTATPTNTATPVPTTQAIAVDPSEPTATPEAPSLGSSIIKPPNTGSAGLKYEQAQT